MMTIDEMKLAVCEKLPELVHCDGTTYNLRWKPKHPHADNFYPHINWPTEGLQVCHEAEKLLLKQQEEYDAKHGDKYYGIWTRYVGILSGLVEPSFGANIRATYEQRLEALCRVWFPERF